MKPGSGLENIKSVFDPALKGKKIGVQAGAHVAGPICAKAGLMQDAHSYRFIVDTRYENPPQEMADDCARASPTAPSCGDRWPDGSASSRR